MSDRSVRFCLFLLILFNFIDTTVTSLFIDLGIAKELNPFMDILLSWGIGYFIFVKIIAVVFACFVFWKYRTNKLVTIGIAVSLLGYLALMVYFYVNIV